VVVRNADGQVSTLAGGFTYTAPAGTPPTVTAATNNATAQPSGPVAGGTAVTITGTGFASGATVLFGAAPATNVVFVSTTELTALTPTNQAQGTVDVTVTIPGGLTGTLHGGFTFLGPAPSVTTFNIFGSPQAGGGLILIKGTNLRADTIVTFDAVVAAFNNFAPKDNIIRLFDELTVVVPPSPLGPSTDGFVTVKVANPDGQSFTLPPKVAPSGTPWPANFHYGPPPAPASFDPGTGKGINVTLTGTGFTADKTGPRVGLQVLFSGPNQALLQILTCPGTAGCPVGVTSPSATTIVVAIPNKQLNPGSYTFTVTNFDFQSANVGGFIVP
jgi:hypothetical protein